MTKKQIKALKISQKILDKLDELEQIEILKEEAKQLKKIKKQGGIK